MTIHPAVKVVLIAGATSAAFVLSLLTAGGVRITAGAGAALTYGGFVVAAVGWLALRLAAGTESRSIALTLLVGTCLTSLALTGGCVVTGRPAATVLIWLSVGVAPALGVAIAGTPSNARVEPLEAGCVVVIAILTALWCHVTWGLVGTIRTTNTLPLWSDYFIHGTEIAQFGDRLAIPSSSLLLVNQPVILYHYASYTLPAAVAGVIDAPGLVLGAVVLLPYGIFMAALGAYALVRTLAGDSTALIAATALLFVPDASRIWLRNGFFGFHWLLLTAPGSGYGIGVAFTALALIAIWKRGTRSSMWLALLLTAGLGAFRLQLAVLFVPALVITLLWEIDFARRHVGAIGALFVGAIAVGMVLVAAVPPIRHAWLQFSAFRAFIELVHTGQMPTNYDGLYASLDSRYGHAVAAVAGLLLLVPAVLGCLTLALPFARIAAWSAAPVPLDSYPFWCLATWLFLVLVMPRSPFGGAEEFQHRPFVWVYAVGLVWTVVYASRALEVYASQGVRRLALCACALALIALVGLTWRSNLERPTFAWGQQFVGNRLEPGLHDAAAFVRSRARPGDAFAFLPTDRVTLLDDAATRFASLANTPAYLARPAIQVTHGERRRAAVEQRILEMQEVEAATDAEAALEVLRQLHVRFLITLGEHEPRFDPHRSSAAFRSGVVAVYEVPET